MENLWRTTKISALESASRRRLNGAGTGSLYNLISGCLELHEESTP